MIGDEAGGVGPAVAIVDPNEGDVGRCLDLAVVLENLVGLDDRDRELPGRVPPEVPRPQKRVVLVLILPHTRVLPDRAPARRRNPCQPRKHPSLPPRRSPRVPSPEIAEAATKPELSFPDPDQKKKREYLPKENSKNLGLQGRIWRGKIKIRVCKRIWGYRKKKGRGFVHKKRREKGESFDERVRWDGSGVSVIYIGESLGKWHSCSRNLR